MKFTKTLAAITAAAMAVSMAVIPASAVEAEIDSGVKTSTTKLNDKGEVDGTMIQIQTAATGGNVALAATDVVTATAKAVDASADTSEWMVAFNAFDASWGGWAGPASEPGVLEFTATVQEMMDKISCTDIANFGGFIFQVWNTPADVEIEWTLKIAPASAETPETPETPEAPETPEEPEVPGESTGTPEGPATDVLPGDSELPSEVKEIEIKPGKMFNDGGWRVNLVHPWAAEEDKEAANIVDAQAFAGTTQISVVFKATNVTEPFTAWLAFATNDDTGLAYWGDGNAANSGVTQVPVKVDKDGYYTVTLTTDVPVTVGDNFFLALQTDNKNEENAPVIELVKVGAAEAVAVDPIVPGASSEEPQNPGTGVTLVVVPAALAAAALATSGIVLKKRSK